MFEQDGATWFRATALGDSRDRVLRKSNGDATYLAGDLAYHRDKFLVRGFDRVIDVFGADHHGQVASLKAGVEALGVDPGRLEVKLGQMVSLVDGDEAVKMGKRAGNAISLDSLVADIGPDATRILSLMSSLDQASTFDLASVREQSVENPVFYVQMASARIGGVGRKAVERGVVRRPLADVDLSLLIHPRELELHPLPRGAARGGGRRRCRPGPDQGHHLGAAAGRLFPRLLPRLPDPGRRRGPGPDAGPAVAGRGHPHRPGHRPGTTRGGRTGGHVTDASPSEGGPRADPSARWPPGCFPLTARVDDRGRLQVGGCDLVELAEQFGTPLFVYDETHLRARCREAVEAWGDGVAYATKAFLCVAMARLAHEEGMCLDVSTGGELHVALSAGVPADRLVLHGNNKSDEELAAALAVGVGRIVVDSFDEIDRLERLVPETPTPTDPHGSASSRSRPRVLARITPGVEVHTHEFVRTGQDDSKFGFGLASGAAARAVDRLTRLDAGGDGCLRGDPRPPGEPGVRPGPLRPGRRGAGRLLRPARVFPSWSWAAASVCPT